MPIMTRTSYNCLTSVSRMKSGEDVSAGHVNGSAQAPNPNFHDSDLSTIQCIAYKAFPQESGSMDEEMYEVIPN